MTLFLFSFFKGLQAIQYSYITIFTKDGDTLLAALRTSDFDPEIIASILESINFPKRPGLTDEQVAKIQTKFCFVFPPDLRAFLQVGFPESFHNWHELALDDLKVDLEDPDPRDTASRAINFSGSPCLNDEEVHEIQECNDKDELVKRHNHNPLVPLVGCIFMPSVPHEAGLPVVRMVNECYDCHVIPNFWTWICLGDEGADASKIPEEWKAQIVPVGDAPFWGAFWE